MINAISETFGFTSQIPDDFGKINATQTRKH